MQVVDDPDPPIAYRTRSIKRQHYNAIGGVCFLGMVSKDSNLEVDQDNDAYLPTSYERDISCS